MDLQKRYLKFMFLPELLTLNLELWKTCLCCFILKWIQIIRYMRAEKGFYTAGQTEVLFYGRQEDKKNICNFSPDSAIISKIQLLIL